MTHEWNTTITHTNGLYTPKWYWSVHSMLKKSYLTRDSFVWSQDLYTLFRDINK